MAVFNYKAIDRTGQEVSGNVESDTMALAINQVRTMGYFPTKVTESSQRRKDKAEKRKRSGFYIGGVNQKQKTLFTRQLATLIDAGLPLLRSLHVLQSQLQPCKMKDILIEMGEDVQGGSTFSESLAKHPKVFDRLFVNMIRAGEVGGMLEVVLVRLAEFMEKRQSLKRRVRGALVYPIVVLTIAAVVVGIIMVKVVPEFKKVFAEFGADLPQSTQMLLNSAEWMKNNYYWIPGIFFGVFITSKLLLKIKQVKHAWDVVVLRIPFFGGMVRKINVARFTRTLGTLVGSGVPILQSLKITKDTLNNTVIADAIQAVHDSVREGDTISAPLEEAKVFPPMVVNMIDVGEETGALETMLEKVADVYDEEVEIAVSALLKAMEPAIIVVLGVIVGFIVISLYMPLFSLADQLAAPGAGQ